MGHRTRLEEPIADSAFWRPPAQLRPLVEGYVGYRYLGWEPGVHRGLPSQHLTFVIEFDRPVRVTMPGERTPSAFDVLVSGFHTAPAMITHDGNQHGVQLLMTPAGCRVLLGVPASALVRECIDLRELWGASVVDRMYEEAEAAPTWSERFLAVDRALMAVLDCSSRHGVEQVASDAWDLVTTASVSSVQRLAGELGWGRRHLGERFVSEFGVSPKVMIRVVRFERSKRMISIAQRPTLAAIAARCGYADQAHMTRDWNDLAGCSPTRWMADEKLRNVQDVDASDTAC